MGYSGFRVALHECICHGHHFNDVRSGVEMNYLARIKSGHARFCGDDFDLFFDTGDVFFLPMGCRYCSYWEGDEVIWDSFAFSHFPDSEEYPIQKINSSPQIEELFDSLGRSGRVVDSETLGEFYTLLGLCVREMKAQGKPHERIVRRATQYMAEHGDADIAEVARHCRISESGLYGAFRKMGKTPVGVRQELQLEKAIAWLQSTDFTVENIAERCGFNSVSYLNRVMKKHTGNTPSHYRKNALV